MDGVAMLSEIHPDGIKRFDPRRQAVDWFGWTPDRTQTPLDLSQINNLTKQLDELDCWLASRGRSLVVRDWSHLDWIGFPFQSPRETSVWDCNETMGCNQNPLRCATVCHPLDQYLHSKRLGALADTWDDNLFWKGTRAFAESVQQMPWVRAEDFFASPETALHEICDALNVSYDPMWKLNFADHDQVTGETESIRRRDLQRKPRPPVPSVVWSSLGENEDFLATLSLLGYPLPEPMRPVSVALQNPYATTPTEEQDDDERVMRCRIACQQTPDDLAAWISLANALDWIGCPGEAADGLLAAGLSDMTNTHPERNTALHLACLLLDRAGRKYESIPLRRMIAAREPQHTENLFQLALLSAGTGAVEEAISFAQQLIDVNVNQTGAAANLLLYLNYSDRWTPAEISNEHFRIGMRLTERPQTIHVRPRKDGEPISIGYLGADFYTHPVGKLIKPILWSHDRPAFRVHVYHDGSKHDAITKDVMEASDKFLHSHGWSDGRLLSQIREDQIDVLIDLGGYTGGGNRLRMLGRRAAPVQASYLGYPNTSAIQTMDYRLTDRLADPPGRTDRLYVERLVHLQNSHLAWTPPEIAEELMTESPDRVSRSEQPPRLGIFNNVAKLSPSMIETVAEILRRVPDAILLMKYGDRYGVPFVADRFRRLFAEQGVLPHRIEYRTRAESMVDHLRSMRSVDLALDSFPYQGTMTSLECLSVGTPILSKCGEYYAHRATSAMMMRMGLYELVAESSKEYAEIAVELMHNRQTLADLRQTVYECYLASPLRDPTALTRELETIYRSWCPGESVP
jgi:predicted O-linked N-acetylglucosamine transferase (SPINDLY family)